MSRPDNKKPGSGRSWSAPGRSGYGQSLRPVEQVLGQVVAKLGLDQRLREHTLMNLWPILVGSPWDQKSRPLFIDQQRQLVVSVCNAAAGQELSLLKPQILKKLQPAARQLAVDIAGLRLDLRRFYSLPPELEPAASPSGPDRRVPAVAELDCLTLSAWEQEQIQALQQQLDQQKVETFGGITSDRIMQAFQREIRLRHFRRLQGYPVCRLCQIPVPVVHGPGQLCACCYLQQGSR